MTADFSTAFDQLVTLQQDLESLHPLLQRHYPVAISLNGQLWIYDFDPGMAHYALIKQVPAPFSIPDDVRAAFDLAEYDNRCVALVTEDAFDSVADRVLILHEFVHCYQFETCEQDLRKQLQIARIAKKAGDFSWELNFPFPYDSEAFVGHYQALLKALEEDDEVSVHESFRHLRAALTPHEWEYMVWQMWKEGYARWVENQIQKHLGLPVNRYGAAQPYNRVSFYGGGAAYFDFLAKREPETLEDLPSLFSRLLSA